MELHITNSMDLFSIPFQVRKILVSHVFLSQQCTVEHVAVSKVITIYRVSDCEPLPRVWEPPFLPGIGAAKRTGRL